MALGTAVTLLLLAAVAAGPAQAAKPLRGKPPYAIGGSQHIRSLACSKRAFIAQPDGLPPSPAAHRGLSGVYPEHTARAYQQAIKAGADFIECDGALAPPPPALPLIAPRLTASSATPCSCAHQGLQAALPPRAGTGVSAGAGGRAAAS